MAGEPHADYWPTEYPSGRVAWFFHRVAANGRVTDPSQGYTTRRSARRGIQRRWPGIKMTYHPQRPR